MSSSLNFGGWNFSTNNRSASVKLIESMPLGLALNKYGRLLFPVKRSPQQTNTNKELVANLTNNSLGRKTTTGLCDTAYSPITSWKTYGIPSPFSNNFGVVAISCVLSVWKTRRPSLIIRCNTFCCPLSLMWLLVVRLLVLNASTWPRLSTSLYSFWNILNPKFGTCRRKSMFARVSFRYSST